MFKQLDRWARGRTINQQAVLLAIAVLVLLFGAEMIGGLPYLNQAIGWFLILGWIASAFIFIVALLLRFTVR